MGTAHQPGVQPITAAPSEYATKLRTAQPTIDHDGSRRHHSGHTPAVNSSAENATSGSSNTNVNHDNPVSASANDNTAHGERTTNPTTVTRAQLTNNHRATRVSRGHA